jgi:hypothetical protein
MQISSQELPKGMGNGELLGFAKSGPHPFHSSHASQEASKGRRGKKVSAMVGYLSHQQKC